MPIYESETLTRDELDKKRKYNVCAKCGEFLTLFWDSEKKLTFLACHEWTRSNHEGISRVPSQYEKEGMASLNIQAKNESIERRFGKMNKMAIEKYRETKVMTREAANEIIEVIWKGAPDVEKKRAAILCADYNLNPLMNHIYLIPFKNKEGGKDWALLQSIDTTRLLAHRKHNFSYLDLTPRIATKEELNKILGEGNIKANTIYCITKIKDMESNAEAYGLGSWNGNVYGEEKGNSAHNMASIRSERQALKRLYPAEMPEMDVVDDRFINANVSDDTFIEGEAKLIEEQPTVTEEPKKPKEIKTLVKSKEKEPEPKETTDMSQLESDLATLKEKAPKMWGDIPVLASMLKTYGVEGATPFEAAKKLDVSAFKDFEAKVQDALDMI